MTTSPSDRTARIAATVLVVVTAALIAVVASWRIIRPVPPHVDIDAERFPVRGIDISAHNGPVDFDSVAAAGIDFVYIKASEGRFFRDRAFMDNYLAARRAGLAVGAYHFFRFDCDAREQAENFLGAIVGCDLRLPPAIDIEAWGNPDGFADDSISRRLRHMASLVADRRGRCMVYTNKQGSARFLSAFADAPADSIDYWICSFSQQPPAGDWHLWQHSHMGSVPGIRGKVDLNTFRGTYAAWYAYLDSIIAAPPRRSPNAQ